MVDGPHAPHPSAVNSHRVWSPQGSSLAGRGNHKGGPYYIPNRQARGPRGAQWPKGLPALSPRLWAPRGISQSPISHLRMTGVRVPWASSFLGSGRLFADGHCALRAFLSSLSPQLQQMKEKKGLYPDKSVYTQQIGPGLCFGALALMLRFFFEVPGWGGRGAHLPQGPPHRTTPSRAVSSPIPHTTALAACVELQDAGSSHL